MMAIMMLTFVFFFAFVVNTANLVNAKINLQNAADLAAYAGAAVQARTLTQISYLNYEMRRQYKKFIYRYYVLGNMAQKDFPVNGGGGTGTTPMKWSPDGIVDYGAPVVCFIFNPNDNTCHIAQLPQIAIPQQTAFDAIQDTLIQNLRAIENIRQENCGKISVANVELLHLWLWNTDPDFSTLQSGALGTDAQIQEVLAVIRGLGQGLGLVPRELLLRRRIETLNFYMNQEAKKEVGIEQVDGFRTTQNPEPAASERTIQAYLSAFYTLGNHTFAPEEIKMDELLPDRILKLNDIKARFEAYAIDFSTPVGAPAQCTPKIKIDQIQNPIPLGVYKDPSILTYYAIRLKAKARLLFSPFGEVQLKAYAAAQPFGSRIGPVLTEQDFVRPGTVNLPPGADAGVSPIGQIPNLPLRKTGDGAQPGRGWDTNEAMGAFYQAFALPGGALPTSISPVDTARAYHVAMAPNHNEGNKFNIPFDGDDPFVRNFDSSGILAFWAPIFPLSRMASADSELDTMISGYLGNNTGDPTQVRSRQQAKQALTQYFARLQSDRGELYDATNASTREGFRIVRLADPVHTRPSGGGGLSRISPTGGFVMTDPAEFKTSWDDFANGNLQKAGRTGYSVKFVSFDLLRNGLSPNGGGDLNENLLPLDPEAEGEVPFVKH